MSDYSTIQQHQPLRTPKGWDGQEKALIVQLDEVFDDIYRRFGRLRLEDMNKEFRTEWADAEGNIATLQGDVSSIVITVQNKYDKISGIAITAEGVDISGSKYLKLESGSSLSMISGSTMDLQSGATLNIKAGGNVNNVISMGNTGMSISSGGKLTLNSGTTMEIKSGGNMSIASGGALAISSGSTFTVDSTNFVIDSNGKVTIKGNSEFYGELKAATGTFTGTLSAQCITSGTMSADRISGGTIDASNVTVKNLDASKITTGTMSANKISGGTIDASNVTITNLDASKITTGNLTASRISGGTLDCGGITVSNLSASSINTGTLNCSNLTITNLSASSINTGELNCSNLTISGLTATDIKGGTLTLGGTNNTNGKIVMKNASDTQIGIWDNNGLEAQGVFSSGNWTLGTDGISYKPGTTDSFHMLVNTQQIGRLGIYANTTASTISLHGLYTGALFTFGSSSCKIESMTSDPLEITANKLMPQTSSGKIGGSNDYWDDAYITTVHNSSSRGVKHDIKPLRDFGYEIDQLSPVSFKYNEGDDETHYGLIWEDTVGVLPVICHMDTENEDQDKAKTITYMDLIPVLLKEIQSLRKRVRALEAV